jgi:hypothetical protein
MIYIYSRIEIWWLVDENEANQGELILELRVCFVVACSLYIFQQQVYEIVRTGFRSILESCWSHLDT